MLINTVQIYLKNTQNKPISLGFDKAEGKKWFLKIIQAKLIHQIKAKISERYDLPSEVKGLLLKKSTFGKWKKHLAMFSNPPKNLKLEDEIFAINQTS